MPHTHRPVMVALTRGLHAHLADAIARRRRSQDAARRHRDLLRLDDHLLRDIGLDPRQVGDRVRFGLPL